MFETNTKLLVILLRFCGIFWYLRIHVLLLGKEAYIMQASVVLILKAHRR